MERIKSIINNRKFQITVLLIGYFVLLFIWSLKQSFNNASDEEMRFQIPKFIFDHGRLPTLFDASIVYEKVGFSYAGQPNLPYIIGAIFMRIASLIGVSTNNLFYAARLVSIISGVIFFILVIKIAKVLFEKTTSKCLMVGLVMFWPQLMFVFTYVNCDSLALVGVATTVLACIKGVKTKWNIRECILLSVGISIIALSYINGLGIAIACVPVFILSFVKCNDDDHKYRTMILKGLLIVGIVALLTGWFYVRNYCLYHSLLGTNIMRETSLKYATDYQTTIARQERATIFMTSFNGIGRWIAITAMSFFGRFGNMNNQFHRAFEIFVLIVQMVILVFTVKGIVKRKKKDSSRRIIEIGLFLGIIITIALSVIYSFSDYQPQGRYLLPMIISYGYFLTLGINEIRKIKNNKLNWLWIVAPGLLFITDLYAIIFMIK